MHCKIYTVLSHWTSAHGPKPQWHDGLEKIDVSRKTAVVKRKHVPSTSKHRASLEFRPCWMIPWRAEWTPAFVEANIYSWNAALSSGHGQVLQALKPSKWTLRSNGKISIVELTLGYHEWVAPNIHPRHESPRTCKGQCCRESFCLLWATGNAMQAARVLKQRGHQTHAHPLGLYVISTGWRWSATCSIIERERNPSSEENNGKQNTVGNQYAISWVLVSLVCVCACLCSMFVGWPLNRKKAWHPLSLEPPASKLCPSMKGDNFQAWYLVYMGIGQTLANFAQPCQTSVLLRTCCGKSHPSDCDRGWNG